MGRYVSKARDLFKRDFLNGRAPSEQVGAIHRTVEDPRMAVAQELKDALTYCVSAYATGGLDYFESKHAVPRLALEFAGKGGDLAEVDTRPIRWHSLLEWVVSLDPEALGVLARHGHAPWSQCLFSVAIEKDERWERWAELGDPFESAGAVVAQGSYEMFQTYLLAGAIGERAKHVEKDRVAVWSGIQKALAMLSLRALPASVGLTAEKPSCPFKQIEREFKRAVGPAQSQQLARSMASIHELARQKIRDAGGWLPACLVLAEHGAAEPLKALLVAMGPRERVNVVGARWVQNIRRGEDQLGSLLMTASRAGSWACVEALAKVGAPQAWEVVCEGRWSPLELAHLGRMRGEEGAGAACAALELAGLSEEGMPTEAPSQAGVRAAERFDVASMPQRAAKEPQSALSLAVLELAKGDLPEGLGALKALQPAGFWGPVEVGETSTRWPLAEAAKAGAWRVVAWAASMPESAFEGLKKDKWARSANPLSAAREALQAGRAEGRESEALDAVAALGKALEVKLTQAGIDPERAREQVQAWSSSGARQGSSDAKRASQRDSAALRMGVALGGAAGEVPVKKSRARL